ncbi:MAG: ribonuclease P protein component [bacterium]
MLIDTVALSKEYILKDKYYFKRVRRLGKTFSTPLFFLNIAPCKDARELKFGLIVTTKVDKRAVERNRIRRALSEAVRVRLPKLNRGYHVVIVAKAAAVGKSYQDFDACFAKLLPKTPL